ncbi:MAG: ROK family transcriptional regulator [Verrucomicrobiaceae bacterium]|nr:ROK family transcriptional regulator [Verrucomicrobiaceae bacterium]
MRTFKSTQQDLHVRIVREIRHGRAASRGALAEILEIAPSTMGIHVEDLVRQGYLAESGLERGAFGRPKRLLRLVPQAGWFAGIEFTGGSLRAVRLDFAGGGEVTLHEPLPAQITAAGMIDRLEGAVRQLSQGASGMLLGVGVGSPGLVDPVKGEVVYSQFQADWSHVPLAGELTRRLGVRVTVENNLHVITLAERSFGGGKNEDDFAVVRARLGFGLGVVKGGRLLPGAHHAVGEIGMLPWPLDGGTQQVHDVLSAGTVWRRLQGAGESEQAPEDLRTALMELAGTRGCAWNAVVTDYARVLGMAQLMIDARVFFLHGPLTSLGSRFCEDVMVRSLECIPALAHSPLRLVLTHLGSEAGALGAASLAMEAWNPEDAPR